MTTLQEPKANVERDMFRDLDVDLAMLRMSVAKLDEMTTAPEDADLIHAVKHNLTAVEMVYERIFGLVKTARIDAQCSLARDRVVKDGMGGWPIPTHAAVCERIARLGRYVDTRA